MDHDAQFPARQLDPDRRIQAAAELDAFIDRDPNRGEPWLLRALLRHTEGRWADALSDVETAMTLEPLPPAGQFVLADCYARTGRTELALLGFEHLLTRRDHAPYIYAGLYTGLRRCGRDDLALVACRAAVEAEPENHAAYFGMAHCMASLGYAASYIASILHTAARLDPENAAYRVSLALQLVRCGAPSEAYEQLNRVPAERLVQVECLCSARRLAQLSVWADDQERAEILCHVIRRLSSDRSR